MASRDRSVFLGSRVARRVFWLFVLSALIPLALSDWLATSVVSEVARNLQERGQAQVTRQTALQVFDRLSAAREALEALSAASSPAAETLARSAQTDRMFSRLVRIDDQDPRHHAAVEDMLATWQRADSGADGAAPAAIMDGASTTGVSLRIVADAGESPLVLMAAASGDALRWIAEIKPSYLWAPVAEAAIESSWRVSDAKRRVLTVQGEDGLIPSPQSDATTAADAHKVTRTSLFLAADLAAGDWEFAQRKVVAEPVWHGAPLGRWLAMVAAGTMLMIALLALGQIRRTLVPLEELNEGTRRIASGESGTRVRIPGSDEFAALGNSFNKMAARIEDQFRTLEGLASIDRDVLAGTPIDLLAERVLGQISAAHPDVAATIVWLDDEAPGRVLRLSCPSGSTAPVIRGSESLVAAHAAWFATLAEDTVVPRTDAEVPPCARPQWDSDHVELALLPLRWSARTQAVLSLGLNSDRSAVVLKAAAELRDRLAVAFSARAREKEMIWRAGHDSLTGLANRHGLNAFVDAMLSRDPAAVGVTSSAILFVDLDNFKDVNDSLGHESGDEILCEASRRLESCASPGALVARQGGDEFVLALPNANEASARLVAAEAVRRLALPFAIGGEVHTFGASVGIAVYPAHGRTRAELLRHADMAMYAAKAGGRGRYALFEESLETASQRRLRLPSELRRALEQGQLVAHYQPRVCPRDGSTTSAEALVRWRHPERGLLMPGMFIALAEETRLIEDIGMFMLDDACSRVGAWRRHSSAFKRVSVNISGRQLASGDLVDLVCAALKKYSLAPQALELEVTESLLVDESCDARSQLAGLRRIGVSIALDDFGTGYSSMAMLRDLPIDVMKIDRAFVKDLTDDPGAAAITRTIATLAHSLHLHLVAEGVETEQQASLLVAMGCDELQGFLYGHAVAPEEFVLPAEGLRAYPASMPGLPMARKRASSRS